MEPMSGWKHPRFSRAWWLEIGLGCAVALTVTQVVTGGLVMVWPGLFRWHVSLGLAALATLPLLALGHPTPREKKGDDAGESCGGSPLAKLSGTLSGMALAVLFFSGPAIVAMHAFSLPAPREAVGWHRLAGQAAVVLVPVHLALSYLARRRRWARRGPDGRPPRFRGHWLQTAAALAALLAAALACA